jgi:5-methylcytosine-specific restriction endonuclease McrA
MKKGYQCQHCGNSDTETLSVIIPESRSLSVLVSHQKTLRRPDVLIHCLHCNKQEPVDLFKIKREPKFVRRLFSVDRLCGSN